MEISGLDDYLHLSDAGYLWMVQRMWSSYDYGEIDFFSFDTRAGKQFVWICCSLGLGFILMMLEDKLL